MASRSRCFVAVWPPPELRTALEGLVIPAPSGLRLIEPLDHHITLRFMGAVDVDAARSAVARLSFSVTSALAGPCLERLGARHLVIPVTGLDGLAGEVAALTADLEEGPTRLPFFGHLTLGTGRAEIVDSVAGLAFDCPFTVAEVALVASGPDGYVTLERVQGTPLPDSDR